MSISLDNLTDEQIADKFDRYGALWMLCARWYSGGASRGYRILSRLARRQYRPGVGILNNRFESEQQREYYRRFLKCRKKL